MFNKIVLALLLTVICIVFYFSWISDPSLSSETYLPRWLLNWSNHYYNLRTAVPFLAVGFLLEIYTDHIGSTDVNYNKSLNFIQNIVIAAIIVCVAEGGQFVIQRRSPDLMDVFYGVLGSLTGALSYNLLKKIKNAKQT
ncbi:VanZ family protein [Flavobacterium sp. 17A]|uniref:VanZ family protein n=1 Tax=Flavobacterium potami TaxID=2872310 RepID=A0A9X1H743_9FLAO|nr:VanZ family protein [Flavobacterium potami]MBZ4033611.1 VanZ family protein [Flavobacterium potami]